MNSDFDSPPKSLSTLVHVGGVATAFIAIAGLQYGSTQILGHTANTPDQKGSKSRKLASSPIQEGLLAKRHKVRGVQPESSAIFEFSKTNTHLKSQVLSASISEDSSVSPMMVSEVQKVLEKTVNQKAAACKFDPSLTPDRGMTFEVKSFYSKAMGEHRNYGLILPPGYHTQPQQSYPVIVLLQGGDSALGSWQACGAITEVLYKLYSSGQLPPAIVVTPDDRDNRRSSSYWNPGHFDGSHGKVATLIGDELVRDIKSHYRVLKEPKYWAMGGLSSGGWGAFNIGVNYLERFNILFSHSGYFSNIRDADNSPIKSVQELSSQERSLLRIYLDASLEDRNLVEEAEQFHQKLVGLGITHTFNVFPSDRKTKGEAASGHYLYKHLENSLSYVGEQWQSIPSP